MKKITKKLQNCIWDVKGSALIMVIICMLLVGIITSVVIVTASTNLSNVMLYKRNAENFYSAEHVLDDFKNALEDLADESVRVAYQNWLTEYSYNSSGEQHEQFKKLFIKDYKERLKAYLNITDEITPEGATPPAITPTDLASIITGSSIIAGADPSRIRFKEAPKFKPSSDTEIILNVQVVYIEDDGTESTIETDLKFSINPEDFKINTAAGVNPEAAEYAVITDETFTNTGVGCTNSTVNVLGNVYGGGYSTGIGLDFANVSGSSVALYSDRIITRNTFRVSNGANVWIKGKGGEHETPGHLTYGNLWAKNILFDKSTTGKQTSITAQGNLYLADDMTLNGKLSYFKLAGPASSFIGYGASENDVGASSAIVVNNRDSAVYMDDPDPAYGGKIAIAGKSFISVPVKFGSNTVAGTSLQGESISYKGEQAAYLLPSECLIGIGHNPMTEEEYQKIKKDDFGNMYTSTDVAAATKGSITCYINISKSALNGGVDLGSYVDVNKPARSFFVNYDDSTKMVYIYLNFRDSDSATAYFAKFYELYPDTVKARTESLSGGISINTLALETVGNSTVTTGSAVYANASGTAVLAKATKKSSDSNLVMEQWRLSTKYNGLTNYLSDTYIGQGSQTYVTDSIVNMSPYWTDITINSHGFEGYGCKPITVNDGGVIKEQFEIDGGKTHYYLYTGRDVHVRHTTVGIIVATGDVYIENGAQFSGLIVARGNVKVTSGNVLLRADPDTIRYFIQNPGTCEAVKQVFEVQNATAGTGSGGNIIASDIIQIEFENWKKN